MIKIYALSFILFAGFVYNLSVREPSTLKSLPIQVPVQSLEAHTNECTGEIYFTSGFVQPQTDVDCDAQR